MKNSNLGAMSPKTKLTISIIAIVVAVALIITISLSIANQAEEIIKSLSGNVVSDEPTSSTLPIKNGYFQLVDESATMYPQTATSWEKYGYKVPSGSSHGYLSIDSNENSVMGVIDVSSEKWTKVSSDLAKQGVTMNSAPALYSNDADSQMYLIANKTKTTASIYSASYSLAQSASIKVTVRLNTSGVTEGNAFVMIKSNGSSALEKTSSGTQQWYAHNFAIENKNGWQEESFYVFNKSSSSVSIYCNVGLGNVYRNEGATGILLIDDIKLETVTANDYRMKSTEANSYEIQATENSNEKVALSAESFNGTVFGNVDTTAKYLDTMESTKQYSPFVDGTIALKQISRTSSDTDGKGLQIALNNIKQSATDNDILHVSFWLRLVQNNVYTTANIYLFDGEDDLNYSIKNITTPQDIASDNNCGWVQYHYYVKPGETTRNLTLYVTLGDKDGYSNNIYPVYPDGTLYVTAPEAELVSASTYSSASSTNTKTIELTTNKASLAVSNGTFSKVSTIANQPQDWISVFAGDNDIFNKGFYTTSVAKDASVVAGSGVSRDVHPALDDETGASLMIKNNSATAFGYMMKSDVTLSANSVYVFSVLAKGEGTAKPYIYIIERGDDIDNTSYSGALKDSHAIIGNGGSSSELDKKFFQTENDGWTRYYFVIVTGDNSKSVNVALFNGSINGEAQQGTVYFDQVNYEQIGSYTRNVEGSKLADDLTFTATGSYPEFKDIEEGDLLNVIDYSLSDVNEPEEPEEDVDEPEVKPERTTDWALIISILSSSSLLGALLIVLVVKLFRKK